MEVGPPVVCMQIRKSHTCQVWAWRGVHSMGWISGPTFPTRQLCTGTTAQLHVVAQLWAVVALEVGGITLLAPNSLIRMMIFT